MFYHDRFGATLKIEGPPVVAEPLPGGKNRIKGGCGKGTEIGERRKECFILTCHPVDLGLLKHYFGDKDGVGVVSLAPREGTAVAAVVAVDNVAEEGGSLRGESPGAIDIPEAVLRAQWS